HLFYPIRSYSNLPLSNRAVTPHHKTEHYLQRNVLDFLHSSLQSFRSSMVHLSSSHHSIFFLYATQYHPCKKSTNLCPHILYRHRYTLATDYSYGSDTNHHHPIRNFLQNSPSHFPRQRPFGYSIPGHCSVLVF